MSFCTAVKRTGPTGQGTSLRASGASGIGTSLSCPGINEGTPRPRKTTPIRVKNKDPRMILLSIRDEAPQGKIEVHKTLNTTRYITDKKILFILRYFRPILFQSPMVTV
jgi:hypothetical protein